MKFKKLSRHGNARAVTIEKPILEMLGIDDDTIMEMKIQGESLVLTPILDQEGYKKKFDQLLEENHRKYGAALSKLEK